MIIIKRNLLLSCFVLKKKSCLYIIYILILDIYYYYFCICGTICSFYHRKYNCQDSNGIFNYKKLNLTKNYILK